MLDSLPKLVDDRIKGVLKTQVSLHVAQGIILEKEKSQAEVAKMIPNAIQQECESFLSEISSQVNNAITNHNPSQVDSPVRSYIESSSGQDYESEPDDDVILNEKVSQELVDEMLQTVNEAKLHKVVDEMLRQQRTSGDEYQYHIDQMQNFLKSDIIWESKKEIIVPPYQPKPIPIKGNTGPENITLSLQKFPAIRFHDNDIEERISRWELGHEYKFLTEIVARRANGCIVSITKSDYKNLNKKDIEDMYLLVINHKVDDYVKTGLLWSLSVFIKSTVIQERVHNF
ncbi:hypothetical protein Tco_0108952 [Tanacetum coccineum]